VSLITLSNEERLWVIDFLKRAIKVEVSEEELDKIFEKIKGKTFEQATTMLGALASDVAYDVARLKYKKVFPYILASLIYQAIIIALFRYAEEVGLEEEKGKKFVRREFNNFIKLLLETKLQEEERQKIENIYINITNEYEGFVQIVQQEASDICGYEQFAQALCSYAMTTFSLAGIALEAYGALKSKGLVRFMLYTFGAAFVRTADRLDKNPDEELEEILDEFSEAIEVVFDATWDILRISHGAGLVTFEETLRQERQEEEAVQTRVSDEAIRYYSLALEQLRDAYNLIASAAKRLKIFGLVLLAAPVILGIGFFLYYISTNPYVWKYLQDPTGLIWGLVFAILLGPILINFMLIGIGAFFFGWSLRLRGPIKTIKESIEALESMPSRFDPVKVHAVINDLMITSTNPNMPSLVKTKCIVALQRIELALDYLRKFAELISKS